MYYFIMSDMMCWKLFKLEESCKQDPAICPNMCGRRYVGVARKSHLKRHLFYECGVPRQFECSLCLKQFKQKVHLKCHLLSMHSIIE